MESRLLLSESKFYYFFHFDKNNLNKSLPSSSFTYILYILSLFEIKKNNNKRSILKFLVICYRNSKQSKNQDQSEVSRLHFIKIIKTNIISS